MILGQNCYPIHRPEEYKSGTNGEPWAVKTKLGWTLCGPLPQQEAVQMTASCVTASEDDALAEQIKTWWDIESNASRCDVSGRSKEDEKALQMLEQITKFDGERYEVGLLWKRNDPFLPNNYHSALSQMKSLEYRLERKPELKKLYQDSIKVDVEKGFVRILKQEELEATKLERQWYVPHHPVENPNKPGKVRRVCNAASKFRGISLNDNLLTGPDLLQNLIGIIFRFREQRIAITADIEAMFLQVKVPPEDCKVLRFLWRDNTNEPVKVYEYGRHIFGAKSSPTCANYALQQVARDNAQESPQITKLIRRNFYMDDFVKSVPSAEQAIKIYKLLRAMLARGGFHLTKWITNCEQTMMSIDQADKSPSSSKTFEAEPTSPSILGLQWNVDADNLEVCRGMQKGIPVKITQRAVLSHVSAVFDPLGTVSPFTIRMRLLLKSIWKENGQSWDKELNEENRQEFNKWASEMIHVNKMALKRTYFESGVNKVDLHIFSDALLEAMCMVAYLRKQESGEVAFVIGKCRVAPIRNMTVAKLEMQAAVFGVRLRELILEEHDIEIDQIVHWTVSTTVLQWLHASNNKQPVFVANRVAEILENSTIDQWRHVEGKLNPADIGTRGMTVEALKESEWLTGPAWLTETEDAWPKAPEKLQFSIREEPEPVMEAAVMEPAFEWERFSSFKKMIRVLSYCLRWRKKKSEGILTVEELNAAKLAVLKRCQKESFHDAYEKIYKGQPLSASDQLNKLSPFLDENGLLRLQGRLQHSKSSYEIKHPILLSAKHYVVIKLTEDAHQANFHEGTEYVRSVLRQEYWIIGLRNALRSVKAKCVKCRKQRAGVSQPFMADLPRERLQERVFPFSNTGVDYFGPFEVKFMRKTMKRWCCLFTCLTTRAVHIEVVPSLEAETCLTAITRFIARRGKPATILSDNGTNFVGAAKEMRDCINAWNQSDIETSLAQKDIKWKFNPPGAPHFGGIWERLVRSCKKAMIAVLDGRSLTDDVLITTMCLVEQTLNARPLTSVSDDPDDLEALTPNHFLLGRANLALPTGRSTLHRFETSIPSVASLFRYDLDQMD